MEETNRGKSAESPLEKSRTLAKGGDKSSDSNKFSLSKLSDGELAKLLVDKSSESGTSSSESDLGEWAVSKSPRKKSTNSKNLNPTIASKKPNRDGFDCLVSPIKIKRRTDLMKELNLSKGENQNGVGGERAASPRKSLRLTKGSETTNRGGAISSSSEDEVNLKAQTQNKGNGSVESVERKRSKTHGQNKSDEMKSFKEKGIKNGYADSSDLETSDDENVKENNKKEKLKVKRCSIVLSSPSGGGRGSKSSPLKGKQGLINGGGNLDESDDEASIGRGERQSSKVDDKSSSQFVGSRPPTRESKSIKMSSKERKSLKNGDVGDTSGDEHFVMTPKKQKRIDKELVSFEDAVARILDEKLLEFKKKNKDSVLEEKSSNKSNDLSSSSDLDSCDYNDLNDKNSLRKNKKATEVSKSKLSNKRNQGTRDKKLAEDDKPLKIVDISSSSSSSDVEDEDNDVKKVKKRSEPINKLVSISPDSPSSTRGRRESARVVSSTITNSGGRRQSPRVSKKLTNYCELSPEKGHKKKQEQESPVGGSVVAISCGNNSPRSRRSSVKPLVESPLAKDNTIKDEDGVSLRNRMSLKRPLNEEGYGLSSPISKHSVQSPRTPSLSLRKQVLESRTPLSAARKRLNLEENGEEGSKINRSKRELTTTPGKRTPTKLINDDEDDGDDALLSPGGRRGGLKKGRRQSIVKTPSKTPLSSKATPRKIRSKDDVNAPSTPATPTNVRVVGQGFLTPVVEDRMSKLVKMSSLEAVRLKLHVSTVPSSLPCREQEFNNIKSFVTSKISDSSGGCMYISGVPGTGKTATAHAVIKCLQQQAIDGNISPFDFVEVNGLRLTDARQAYVRIWQNLSGNKLSPDQALRFLEKKFSSKPRRSTVLLVDELDYVCNKRQDVVYNILDWPSKQNSKLVILTIANTMDLPERTLKGKVTSRMGLTRLVFQPYTYKQLQEIVMERLSGSACFHVDAVQLVSRKVAAVSGDARRALDICRRATEMLNEKEEKVVSVDHVEKALTQIFSGTRVLAIKNATYMGQLVLRSIRDETQRTGIEETNVARVYSHLKSICPLEGSQVPSVGQLVMICRCLSASGLITCEQGRRDINTKVTLNVSSDDIHYALSC